MSSALAELEIARFAVEEVVEGTKTGWDRERLHVSIPNARHFSLLVDLVLRGTFGYAEFGHRDATHLRWYTRRDIVALVGRTGWDVQWAVADTFRGRNRYVDRLTLRRAREFLALQWHVLAHAD